MDVFRIKRFIEFHILKCTKKIILLHLLPYMTSLLSNFFFVSSKDGYIFLFARIMVVTLAEKTSFLFLSSTNMIISKKPFLPLSNLSFPLFCSPHSTSYSLMYLTLKIVIMTMH